jgi:hypothetical protein
MESILDAHTSQAMRYLKQQRRALRARLLSLPGLKAEVSWSTSDERQTNAVMHANNDWAGIKENWVRAVEITICSEAVR